MKNQFRLSVIYLLVGLIFVALCFIYPDITIFIGLAATYMCIGVFAAVKYVYWKKRPTEYAEKKENETIEFNDERKEMIRGKAARLSILANWILQAIIIVTLAILVQLEVLPYDYVKPIILGVALYWVISTVIAQFIYKWLSKKF